MLHAYIFISYIILDNLDHLFSVINWTYTILFIQTDSAHNNSRNRFIKNHNKKPSFNIFPPNWSSLFSNQTLLAKVQIISPSTHPLLTLTFRHSHINSIHTHKHTVIESLRCRGVYHWIQRELWET